MSIKTRLDKLEIQCKPPVPDLEMEARLRRACARLAAMLEVDIPEPTGPVYRTTDPYTALKSAERRAECEK